MDTHPLPLWSFKYAFGGATYSIEIPANTREEAEGRMAAAGAAGCEGIVRPAFSPLTPPAANTPSTTG